MASLDTAYAHVENLLKEGDRDRWLASLFAPPDKRRHIQALAAFSLETARVRELVHEPMPGEIRLQWWADLLAGDARGDVFSHPVAAALLDTLARFQLPRIPLANLIEARRFDLYNDPMPTLTDLEGYAGETASILFQMAAMVLAGGEDPKAADTSGHAGVAYAMVGFLRALPIHARRGQVFLPRDLLTRHGVALADLTAGRRSPELASALAEMRTHAHHHFDLALGKIPFLEPPVRPAFVGLGLLPRSLRMLQKRDDPFSSAPWPGSWRKPLELWLFGRKIG